GRTELAARIPLRTRSPRDAAQPEIGEAGARFIIGKSKITQSAIISRVDVILALAHVLKATLDLVAAMRKDHVIFELALGRVEYLDQIAKSKAGCSPVITRDVHFNQAWRLSVAAGYAQSLTYVSQ